MRFFQRIRLHLFSIDIGQKGLRCYAMGVFGVVVVYVATTISNKFTIITQGRLSANRSAPAPAGRPSRAGGGGATRFDMLES